MKIPIFRWVLIAAGVIGMSACGTVAHKSTPAASIAESLLSNATGPPSIVINLSEQKATLLRGGEPVAESEISSGRQSHPTPTGSYHIIRMEPSHRSGVYGAYVDGSGSVVVSDVDVRQTPQPAGSHFLGASMPYFMEFKPGFGMHAGYLPGYPASHGCVRMPYSKAQLFYDVARPGTPVRVTW